MIPRFLALTLCLVLVATSLLPAHAQRELPKKRIGVVVDGPWSGNNDVRVLIQREILDLAEGEFDVSFPEGARFVGDWSVASVKAAIDQLLADPGVDIVIGLGVIASHDLTQRPSLSKPCVAPIVIDAHVQELPNVDGTSGVKNLNYIVYPKNLRRDIEGFLEVVPFRKLVMFFSKNTMEALGDIEQRIPSVLADLNLQIQIVAVDQSIDEALERMSPNIEAAYIAPLLHIPESEWRRFVGELTRLKIPTFSMFGQREVEAGVMLSMTTDPFPSLSRRLALNVQRIMIGDDPGTLRTTFTSNEQLTINMATARDIGVYPPWSVLTDAVQINRERTEVNRVLTLNRAIEEAIDVNLDLAARQRAVAASEQDINQARANLLPQIDLSSLSLWIDPERADASAGQQAQFTVDGQITLNQLIYADPAWAEYSIQKHLQDARVRDFEAVRLDIAQEALVSYVNVLLASTVETIQLENLRRTRQNLELARVREAIGTARAAEVLRWRSQLADNRKTVIEANANRNLAEIQLNRVLNRPAEEAFDTQEVDVNDPSLLTARGRLLGYMDNPWEFKMLRSFMTEYGLKSTPEVQALRSAVYAQERGLSAATRSFYLPTLSLQASVNNIFIREGAGSDFDSSGLPPGFGAIFKPPEDASWDVGFSLNYSLFEGGRKIAIRRQQIESLGELRLQLASTEQRIEQRIRSAFHNAGASYAGIQQARLASEAANETLVLVEDSYGRGAATIIDLLDAQNNALVSAEVAAQAVFDFLLDLSEAERSVGLLVVEMSQEERDAFFDQIDAYAVTWRTSNDGR